MAFKFIFRALIQVNPACARLSRLHSTPPRPVRADSPKKP